MLELLAVEWDKVQEVMEEEDEDILYNIGERLIQFVRIGTTDDWVGIVKDTNGKHLASCEFTRL